MQTCKQLYNCRNSITKYSSNPYYLVPSPASAPMSLDLPAEPQSALVQAQCVSMTRRHRSSSALAAIPTLSAPEDLNQSWWRPLTLASAFSALLSCTRTHPRYHCGEPEQFRSRRCWHRQRQGGTSQQRRTVSWCMFLSTRIGWQRGVCRDIVRLLLHYMPSSLVGFVCLLWSGRRGLTPAGPVDHRSQ